MTVIKDVRDLIRDLTSYSKINIPGFEEELITADSDSIKDAMTSSDTVRVFRKRNWLLRSLFIGFEPLSNPKNIGFILYPGAFVEAKAYAPIARSMADLGYYAAVTTPPLELSLTDVDLADAVKRYWKDAVDAWALSGHSLGGVVAAAYANQHISEEEKRKLKGVVMLASYPSDQAGFLEGDLRNDPYRVTSIYGTRDGLTTLDDIAQSKHLLPIDAAYVPIEGGNHTQFYYAKKLQKKDNPATISRDRQQEMIRENIRKLLLEI